MSEESGKEDPRRDHWRRVWRQKQPQQTSWYQAEPEISLALIDAAAPALDRPVIDIGGGASLLVDALLARGHGDVTVLDIAPEAFDHARARLGAAAARVQWISADITTWQPSRRYALWHDRAVFHFLTGAADQAAYGRALEAGLAADGQAVIATFASDGPEKCSGLPVRRHDPASLVAALGGGLEVLEVRREAHPTPAGMRQSFLWCRLARAQDREGACQAVR
ncbi:class I SAM-dependent methyltransferase [Marinibaculum pumilum]|uniref:Class I SAM-dependent methyltransferase n=1 Tax=Marinibaculum pumilum TaxID=1766165 RepID=A0ABV7KYB5_9PROT